MRPHSEEFHDLSSSPNIILVIKSRLEWTGENLTDGFYRTGGQMSGKRDQLEYPDEHWRIFKEQDGAPGLIWLRIRTSGGHLGKL